MKHQLESNVGDVQDERGWRNYVLETRGDSLMELLKDAWIWEYDKDGGECGSGPIKEYPSAVSDKCVVYIVSYWISKQH